MADEVDSTNDRIEKEESLMVGEVCRQAALIPKGEPGECYYCGEEFSRVIPVTDYATEVSVLSCGRCRDRRGL